MAGYWEQVAEMERQNRDESEVEVARLQRRLRECQTQRDELREAARQVVAIFVRRLEPEGGDDH